MGLAFVPLTFPTTVVAARMATTGYNTSWGEVDQYWDIYKQGVVDSGIPFYKKGAGSNLDIIKFMESKGLPRGQVVAFLNATEAAALDDGWGVRWINPTNENLSPVTSVVKALGEGVSAGAKPVVDTLLPVIKWASIALLVAGGAYLVWEGSKLIKRKRKRVRNG